MKVGGEGLREFVWLKLEFDMIQDEVWVKKYQELTVFIVTNKRNPSQQKNMGERN